jgi:hypothetical protein
MSKGRIVLKVNFSGDEKRFSFTLSGTWQVLRFVVGTVVGLGLALAPLIARLVEAFNR